MLNTTIIEALGLPHNTLQDDVPFFNAATNTDNRACISFTLLKKKAQNSVWAKEACDSIDKYFNLMFDASLSTNPLKLEEIFSGIHENNHTCLGFCENNRQGKSLGPTLKTLLIDQIKHIVFIQRLGFFSPNLFTFILDDISVDRTSDIIASIIKGSLLNYTMNYCHDNSIKTESVLVENVFDRFTGKWEAKYFELPKSNGSYLILLPKDIITTMSKGEKESQLFFRHLFVKVRESGKFDQSISNPKRGLTKKDFKAYWKSLGVKTKASIRSTIKLLQLDSNFFNGYDDEMNPLTTIELEWITNEALSRT